jgi:hypothetical protein
MLLGREWRQCWGAEAVRCSSVTHYQQPRDHHHDHLYNFCRT